MKSRSTGFRVRTTPMWILLPLLLALSGCRSARIAPTEAPPTLRDAVVSEYPLGFPIIDAHLHTQFEGMKLPLDLPLKKVEEFTDQLKRAGVVGGIAHTIFGDYAYQDMRGNGILHCGSVGKVVNVAAVEKGLKSGKYGCIKIYLGYIYRYAYDAAYEPIYKLAQHYDVPVVFHTGDTWDKKGMVKYADPLTIDEVAVRHPKVRFVIAHCGNPWINSAAEVIYKNDNVFGDLSAFMVGNMDEQPAEKVEEYAVKPMRWIFGWVDNPKKLLFGSDWPLSDIAAYARVVKRAIPEEHWKAVFHDNALAVFTRLKTSVVPHLPQ